MNLSLKSWNQSKTDGSKFILQNHFPINDIEVWQTDRENVDKISCRHVILRGKRTPEPFSLTMDIFPSPDTAELALVRRTAAADAGVAPAGLLSSV